MPWGICLVRSRSGATAALLVAAFCSLGRGQQPAELTVVPVRGAGSTFDVEECCDDRTLAVEVTDPSGRPLAGAQVTFRLPDDGPGGFFPDFARTAFVSTDGRGRASVSGLRHNGVVGEWNVGVVVQQDGRRGAAEIAMENALGEQAEAAGPGRWRGLRRWLIVGGLAGGAAAGLYAGGVFGDEIGAAPPRGSVSVGPPQVGAP